jgi:hypothetical protein
VFIVESQFTGEIRLTYVARSRETIHVEPVLFT